MLTLVLLLRGINVGKAKQVPMPELRTLLEDDGFLDVATLLRSGNVVVSVKRAREPETVARQVSALIEGHFGFEVAVVARTADELAQIAAKDPFDGAADDGSRRLVAFLAGAPDKAAVKKLADLDMGEDRFAADGRELHLWCPGGQTDSVLAKELARAKLGTTVTVRNWNTVEKLLTLTGAEAR